MLTYDELVQQNRNLIELNAKLFRKNWELKDQIAGISRQYLGIVCCDTGMRSAGVEHDHDCEWK